MKKLIAPPVPDVIKVKNLWKSFKERKRKAGFDKTPKKQLIHWLKEEIRNYEKAKTKILKRNKLMDIIVLVMQIARRENMSLDKAWKRWWKKSRKYVK